MAARRMRGRSIPTEIELSSAIRRLEEDFGLDDRGLAQALGVDRRTLTRWGTGDTYP